MARACWITLCGVLVASPARADFIYTEADAGGSVAAAESVVGSGLLRRINGTLSPGDADADMFRFAYTGAGPLTLFAPSAAFGGVTVFDPTLTLYSAATGEQVAFNDDLGDGTSGLSAEIIYSGPAGDYVVRPGFAGTAGPAAMTYAVEFSGGNALSAGAGAGPASPVPVPPAAVLGAVGVTCLAARRRLRGHAGRG